jgi:hypothetical protein
MEERLVVVGLAILGTVVAGSWPVASTFDRSRILMAGLAGLRTMRPKP